MIEIQDNNAIQIENMQMSRSLLKELAELNRSSNKLTLTRALKMVNETVTFNIIGADRLDATLICLLKASYVIQSQRYVRNDLSSFRTLSSSNAELNEKYDELIKDTIDLYERMTELKEESKNKKRTTISDYKHGIPIEDARYIFPLTAKTNISISLSGDKFIAFLTLIVRYKDSIMNRLYNAMNVKLHSMGLYLNLINKCVCDHLLDTLFAENEDELLKLNSKVLVDIDDTGIDNIVRGILTSTSSNPIEAEKSYSTSEKKEALIKRVTGYNHTSVLEQSRFTSLMKCSLVTFQQLSRHRIAVTQPIDPTLLTKLVEYKQHIIPKTIQESEFINEYKDICDRYKELMVECSYRDNMVHATCLLQNGDVIPFNYTVNVRTDMEVMNKRLCTNAQWEIRELMQERKKLLLETILAPIYKEFARKDCGLARGCQEGAYSCDPKVREEAMKKKKNK